MHNSEARSCSNSAQLHYPLDFIERHLIGTPVVELGRPRAGVVRHECRVFERAAELPKHRNPGRTERVIADA